MANTRAHTADGAYIDGIEAEIDEMQLTDELRDKLSKTLIRRCHSVVLGDAETNLPCGLTHIESANKVIDKAYVDLCNKTGIAGIRNYDTNFCRKAAAKVKRYLALLIRLAHEKKHQERQEKERQKAKKKSVKDGPFFHWTWWRLIPRAKFPLGPNEAPLDLAGVTAAMESLQSHVSKGFLQERAESFWTLRDINPALGWAWWPEHVLARVKMTIVGELQRRCPRLLKLGYDEDSESDKATLITLFPKAFATVASRYLQPYVLLDEERILQDILELAKKICNREFGDIEYDEIDEDADDSEDRDEDSGLTSEKSTFSAINAAGMREDSERGSPKPNNTDSPAEYTSHQSEAAQPDTPKTESGSATQQSTPFESTSNMAKTSTTRYPVVIEPPSSSSSNDSSSSSDSVPIPPPRKQTKPEKKKTAVKQKPSPSPANATNAKSTTSFDIARIRKENRDQLDAQKKASLEVSRAPLADQEKVDGDKTRKPTSTPVMTKSSVQPAAALKSLPGVVLGNAAHQPQQPPPAVVLGDAGAAFQQHPPGVITGDVLTPPMVPPADPVLGNASVKSKVVPMPKPDKKDVRPQSEPQVKIENANPNKRKLQDDEDIVSLKSRNTALKKRRAELEAQIDMKRVERKQKKIAKWTASNAEEEARIKELEAQLNKRSESSSDDEG